VEKSPGADLIVKVGKEQKCGENGIRRRKGDLQKSPSFD